MLPCFVVLDLETTGGNATQDRITEIAAVRVEDGVVRKRWSTLVNPGVRIPPFIQSLTGISDAMVRDAPRFEQVAPTLLDLLNDAVFVAHNARFDHSFVLNELARMELPFKTRTLCTVRLSRKLYPQFKGHGLDAIMQRHGLSTTARHRAMGDVDVVLDWLAQAQAELGPDTVRQAANELLQGSASMPPHLETPISDIPEGPGVYLFYGEGPLPIYIGKSVTLRKRVLSHFQSASRVAREMRILSEIRRIEWKETAGELGALLLEARLVKEMQPVYNRQLRRERGLCAWQLSAASTGKPQLELVQLDDFRDSAAWQAGRLYGTYRSRRQALEALRELADKHVLCPQWLGLESGKGACFAHQLGKCRGACTAHETPEAHYSRLQLALAEHRLRSWPFSGVVAVREYSAAKDRTDIHLFEQWCHRATVHDETELMDALAMQGALAFDLDTYRMLARRLGTPQMPATPCENGSNQMGSA